MNADPKRHLFVSREVHEAGLSPAAFRVLFALRYHCGRNPTCHPGVRLLSTTCRLHRDAVTRSIFELEREGWVQVLRADRRVNIYRLTVPNAGTTVPDADENCPVFRDRTVPPDGTKGVLVLLEGAATSPEKKLETDDLQRLRESFPGVDVDQQLELACRKKGTTSVDLDWFEREWLPRATGRKLHRRANREPVSQPSVPVPSALGKPNPVQLFGELMKASGDRSFIEAVGSP